MKSLPLILAALRRKPVRTSLTMLGVVVAFVLFGLLQGVDSAFTTTLERMKLDRLFVDARLSQRLPIAYRPLIEKVAGVSSVAEISFLSGYYQNENRTLLAIATNHELWLGSRPEYTIPTEQIATMRRTPNGAIVSDWTANHYGLKVGDTFTLRTQLPNVNGTSNWPFVVAGIMTYIDPTQELSLFLANFRYLDEGRVTDRSTVNRFLVRIDDPRQSARICRQVDALFATSGVQTRTQSEHEMGQSQMAELGDIRFFTRSIIAAVMFTLLVLTANTMMESVRERTSELAVLKSLGFSDSAVLCLVVVESSVVCLTAAAVGLALAAALFPLTSSYIDATALFQPAVVVSGMLIAAGLSLASALIPGWRALRLNVADALGRR